MKMDVAALGTNTVTAAEALLGYNSGMLALVSPTAAVTPLGRLGGDRRNGIRAFGLTVLSTAPLACNSMPARKASALPDHRAGQLHRRHSGLTVGFFRVQTNRLFNPDGTLVKDTRLTKSALGVPSLLTAFTANTGELVIDNQVPTIADQPRSTAPRCRPTASSGGCA